MSYINNPPNINETFIIEQVEFTGSTDVISACTAVYTTEVISCVSDTSILLAPDELIINKTLLPIADATIDAGTPVYRFRNINTVSGTSTVWSSSEKVITPVLDLGYDSQGFHRVLTANSSILQSDVLNGGDY